MITRLSIKQNHVIEISTIQDSITFVMEHLNYIKKEHDI